MHVRLSISWRISAVILISAGTLFISPTRVVADPIPDPAPIAAAPVPTQAKPKSTTMSCVAGAVLRLIKGDARWNFGRATRREQEKAFPALQKLASNSADEIRRIIQNLNGHRYPETMVSDATVAKAYALTEEGWGNLTSPQAKFVDPSGYALQIQKMIQTAKNYKSDLNALKVNAANLTIERDVIQEELWKTDARKPVVTIDAPLASLDEKGQLVFEKNKRQLKFKSIDSMRQQLRETQQNIANLTRLPLFGKNLVRDRVLLQVVTLRQLEIARNMIEESINDHPGLPLPQSLQAIVDSINTLCVPEKKGAEQFLDAYRPPTWAWRKLHLVELGSEAHTWIYKTVPEAKQSIESNKIIQFVNNLTPAEKAKLGYNKIADKIGILAQTRWGVVTTTALSGISAGLAGTTNGRGVTLSTIDWAVSYLSGRQNCAEQTRSSDYTDCRVSYLRKHYGSHFSLTDPKVVADLKKIEVLHQKYVKDQNIQRDQEDLVAHLKGMDTAENPFYRAKVIETPDSQFKAAIMDAGPSGLLSDRPVEFEIYKKQIQTILNQPMESPAQRQLLQTLTQSAPLLGRELSRLISEHVSGNVNTDEDRRGDDRTDNDRRDSDNRDSDNN